MGVSGVGGLLSYLDAKKSKDAYAKYSDAQKKMMVADAARRAMYDTPANFKNLREQVKKPAVGSGSAEALFFKNNSLGSSGMKKMADGGLARYFGGSTGGQDDLIDARLSDGEYVFDADIVAALGDGNNAAGAAILDEMRENIRKHKRSAKPNKIPPKAKRPEQYMKRGK